jgi:signal transduction histidine kinase
MPVMRGTLRPKVTAAAIAAAVTASLVGAGVSFWVAAADHQSTLSPALGAAVVVAFAVVGGVVASARPHNRVGWLMLAGGVMWAVGNASVDVAHRGIVASPGSVPGTTAWALAGASLRNVGWYAVTLGVPILFPDGRVVAGKRWRRLPRVVVVITVCSVLDTITAPDGNLPQLGHWHNPIALASSLQFFNFFAFLASLPLAVLAYVAAAVQLRVRWRQGSTFERQQLTLFVLAAGLPIAAVPIGLATNVGWVFDVAALPLPFTIGFAILARGLYDLRTAANRTLVWLLLSSAVVGVYVLVIAGVGGIAGSGGATWLPWIAAAVVAISFAPLRDGLQRSVNRITFGRWDEPYDVLAELGQQVAASADVDRLLSDIVTELTEGFGLVDVSICDAAGHVLAGAGAPAADSSEVTLSAYGRPVGSLRYAPPSTPLRARDRRLLDDLAGHLAGLLHAHRLTVELQGARERLVLAREEERRRLRRDLHDGLGPALAGHLLRLDVLAAKIDPRSEPGAEVAALRDDIRGTVLDVRRVVEGLRPPALDELGLTRAVAQVAQRLTSGTSTAVVLHIRDLPPLPAAIEVAAFRIVSEAVTNVVRHADAASCDIAFEVLPGLLRVTIEDDGRGVDGGAGHEVGRGRPSGHGLDTMRERAEELRGRLRISADRGTTITAELPIPPGIRETPPRTVAVSRP